MIPNRRYTRQDRIRVVYKMNPDEISEDNLVLDSAAEAFSHASIETLEIMGYNVVAENGWVIKVFANGAKEKIKKIGENSTNPDLHA